MAKVKIFVGENTGSVEEDINEFINGDEVGSVIDIKYSAAITTVTDSHNIEDPYCVFTALVYYTEKVESDFHFG
ncbi:hypothetical protein PWYN_15630 [Paenibacillus wynnii]|uniref:Sporulation protein Cse60 n=2 Tax=Paenibacillus wynnii TaxID=268407 RepID=A0A098MEZ7_9BACL|nr:hypothetical protein PWYN_15630 [Paenibacillus wynnii]